MVHILSRIFSILSVALCIALYSVSFISASENSRLGSVIKTIAIVSPQGEVYKELKSLIPISEGDFFSLKAVRQSIEKLIQTGKFSNIIVSTDPDAAGISLKFTVIDKIRIGAIQWGGNREISNSRLEEIAGLKVDNELQSGWETTLKETLTHFYLQEGYFNVKINISSKPMEKPSRLHLILSIAEGARSLIGNITFTGNTGLDSDTLLDTLRIRTGFYYSENAVRKAVNDLMPRFLRARYLKVKIKEFILHMHPPDQVDIEIPIEAGSSIRVQMVFKGPAHYLSATLRRLTLIDSEKSADESILEDSAKRLVEFYQNEGYPSAEVRYERREDLKGKIVQVYFYITEGPRVILSNVVIKGNPSVPDEALKGAIPDRKTGFWIPRYLRLPLIPDDLQALGSVYRSNGFLFVQIQNTVRYSKDKTRAILEFEMTEGVRTLVHKITLEGISQPYLNEIGNLIRTRQNRYYNIATVLEDKIGITTFYHKRGYADMKVEATGILNENRDQADVKFEVSEGNIIKIGKIRVNGNERTKPNVILRELYVRPGDLYLEELLLKSQRKILQLGYFQTVKIQPENEEENETFRDIVINVRERDAGAFEFGAGYADVERFQGFAELSHKNIAGTGRKASLRTEVSQISNKQSADYMEPWIFNFPLDAKGTVFYENKRKVTANYSQTTLGSSVGVEKSFRDYYKFSLLYQYENVHYIDVPLNQQLIPEDQDHVNIASLNPAIFRDTRDDFLNPTRGSFNAAWFRWAAQFMGSEIQEVKLTLQSSWFFDLGSHVVMGVSGRAGAANNFGETRDVPLIERFKLGGRSTIRGYTEDTVGTLGQTLNTDFTPIGGNTMVVFNWELRYNLPKSFGLVLFFDSGNVWRYYNTFWSSPLKSSIGPGLRYNTPVGPVRFDIGYKLNREEGESASEFHFTLGHAF